MYFFFNYTGFKFNLIYYLLNNKNIYNIIWAGKRSNNILFKNYFFIIEPNNLNKNIILILLLISV